MDSNTVLICRAKRAITAPWLQSAAMALSYVYDEKCPTACVRKDGRVTLGAWWAKLESDSHRAAVIAHEVLHVGLRLWDRLGDRDKMIANVAHDACVNHIVARLGLPLPDGCITFDSLGLPVAAFEETYAALVQNGSAGGGGFDVHEDGGEGMGPAIEGTLRGAFSSCPVGASREIDRMLGRGVQDWRTLLRSAVNVVLRGRGADLTYARPHDYQTALGYDVPLPRRVLRVTDGTTLLVAVDTSGSIDGPLLSAFQAECHAIGQVIGGGVRLCSFDHDVYDMGKVDLRSPLKRLKGGGGTSFMGVADLAARMRARVVVCLTDGYGEPPASLVPGWIWALVPGGQCPVNWGKVVHLERM